VTALVGLPGLPGGETGPVQVKGARKLAIVAGFAWLVQTSGQESVRIQVAISAAGQGCVSPRWVP